MVTILEDLTFSQMLKMQFELWEKNKESWAPIESESGRESLLWMIGEIGEVIDIIKKCGGNRVMTDESVRQAFVEELSDVLMYFNDALLRYGIEPKDIASAYTAKHDKNMRRDFIKEAKKFSDNFKEDSENV